ncbi:transmembrane protein 81 [Perognathus longimembris pacificus]|uniref:transmembrane protein 81 n=1 Tax=Perognathus longimembris pacificus TaxID=214514 RepID=UPI0020185D75|nr:transmembrane protein 81 [Perognathus longimembris pacificus]
MEAARSVLGILVWATYPMLVTSLATVAIPKTPETMAIPKQLQEAVGKVVVNTTTCSVTCGLGYKDETVCVVGPDGVRRNCTSQRQECLSSWSCGMLHFTVLKGSVFELSCLSADILQVGEEAFRFTWKVARGVISINDLIFKPYRSNSHFLLFKPVLEAHAGTYRCDVQQLKNLRLVKRLYFGVRVLPPKLVNLNFDQSLTESQKLLDKGLEVNLDNDSRPSKPKWRKKVTWTLGSGAAIGVFVGVLLSVVLCKVVDALYGTESPN